MTVSNTIMPTIDGKLGIVGEVSTPVGIIPRVATHLNAADRMGAVRVRIGLPPALRYHRLHLTRRATQPMRCK